MATLMETVEVASVLILDSEGRRLLLDYNPQWRCYTLPMSKRHPMPGMHADDTTIEESLDTTALRATTEVLGRPLRPSQMPTRLNVAVPPYSRSGRDGQWKRYQHHVFVMRIDGTPNPLDGHSAVWLTPNEIETNEPMSPTVRDILRAIPFAEVKKSVGL